MFYLVQHGVAEGDSLTVVQATGVFVGSTTKENSKKRSIFEGIPEFGAGRGRYDRSEVERILYNMILKQYLDEVVSCKYIRFVISELIWYIFG